MPADYLPPPAPAPAPAPAYAPAVAPARTRDPLLTGVVLIVLAFACTMGGLTINAKFLRPEATPAVAPTPTIPSIVRAYLRDYPITIRSVAADLRSGKVPKDKNGDALEAARSKSVDALGALMAPGDPAQWEQIAAAFEENLKP